MDTHRRLSGVLLALLAAGCQSSMLEPGDRLSGRWFGDYATLVATRDSIVLAMPCDLAIFDPIVVDSSRRFSADARTLTETGNINHSPDDQLHVDGNLTDDGLTLQLRFIRPGLPGDPVVIMLKPGRGAIPLVCPA
ncbi:MAG: hypothetical protein ACREK8_08320 [Gemmatimonadales bacterium]